MKNTLSWACLGLALVGALVALGCLVVVVWRWEPLVGIALGAVLLSWAGLQVADALE